MRSIMTVLHVPRQPAIYHTLSAMTRKPRQPAIYHTLSEITSRRQPEMTQAGRIGVGNAPSNSDIVYALEMPQPEMTVAENSPPLPDHQYNWQTHWREIIPVEIPISSIQKSTEKTKSKRDQDCKAQVWQYIENNIFAHDNPDIQDILQCKQRGTMGINGGIRKKTEQQKRRIDKIIEAHSEKKYYAGNYTDQMRKSVISPFKLVDGGNGKIYLVGYIPK